jgi:HlyD family secretion protein
VFVEPGQAVQAGDPIISLKLVPDNLNLNRAELELAKARIAHQKARRELERQQGLHASKVVPDAEFEKYQAALELAQEDLEWAENNLLLIKEGASARSGQVSNVIFSPSAGMVLEVPVKAGGSVMESSSFNAGTTIATVADMGHLVFEGQLDESEIGKVRTGMELVITVAALAEQKLSARLDYIAPKGEVNQGAVQFQVKASLQPPPGLLLRAGYSASADIVLGRAQQALAVQERDVLFEGDRTFVEVRAASKRSGGKRSGGNRFARREVTLGLSDGIHVQIKSGLAPEEYVKVQAPATGARPSP